MWQVLDSNQRRLSRRIYSPLPLAARATCHAPSRKAAARIAQHIREVSHGRFIVRHRQQGRPPGGRQRAEPGRQGALQRFDFRGTGAAHRVAGREGVEITRQPEERAKAALDVFKEKLVKREHLAEGARRRRAAAVRQGRTRSPAPLQAGHLAARTPRRSPRSSATRAPRASRPRSRATSCGSRARAVTTCRPCIALLEGQGPRRRAAVRQLPLSRTGTVRAADLRRPPDPPRRTRVTESYVSRTPGPRSWTRTVWPSTASMVAVAGPACVLPS